MELKKKNGCGGEERKKLVTCPASIHLNEKIGETEKEKRKQTGRSKRERRGSIWTGPLERKRSKRKEEKWTRLEGLRLG